MTRSYLFMEAINGETITGIALIFLASLFIYAGSVNQIWALILPADFLILAIGGGFLALGIITMKRQKKTDTHTWLPITPRTSTENKLSVYVFVLEHSFSNTFVYSILYITLCNLCHWLQIERWSVDRVTGKHHHIVIACIRTPQYIVTQRVAEIF